MGRRRTTMLGLSAALAGVLGVGLAGCTEPSGPVVRSANGCATGFAPTAIRLEPSFTTIRLRPERGAEQGDTGGIEVYLSLQDQFGDALKALGVFRFELFQYRPARADPRGVRFERNGVQEWDLRDRASNQQHWDRITQSYRLRLALPDLPEKWDKIVVQATFISPSGYRLSDRLIVNRK